MFLKNRNTISKIKRSKVTNNAALNKTLANTKIPIQVATECVISTGNGLLAVIKAMFSNPDDYKVGYDFYLNNIKGSVVAQCLLETEGPQV